MDDQELTSFEIVDALHPVVKGTVDRNAKELFRFDIVTGRLLNVPDVLALTTLDVSHASLALLKPDVLCRLVSLRSLNLSKNCLDDEVLDGAKLHLLPLTSLDVSHNQLRDLGRLASLLDRIPTLEFAKVAPNPAFPRDGNRVALLSTMVRATRLGFALTLNGVPVTIEERVRAVDLKRVVVEALAMAAPERDRVAYTPSATGGNTPASGTPNSGGHHHRPGSGVSASVFSTPASKVRQSARFSFGDPHTPPFGSPPATPMSGGTGRVTVTELTGTVAVQRFRLALVLEAIQKRGVVVTDTLDLSRNNLDYIADLVRAVRVGVERNRERLLERVHVCLCVV